MCRARLTYRPDDGGSKDLWNAGKFLPDYTALQPRRQPSSYSRPWQRQILRSDICRKLILCCQSASRCANCNKVPQFARTGAALADWRRNIPRLLTCRIIAGRKRVIREMQGDSPENMSKQLHTFQAARSEILIPPNSPQSAVRILTQLVCCCSLNVNRFGTVVISICNTVLEF
jgi:hypothetical protein